MSEKSKETHQIRWRGTPPPVTRADFLKWEDGPENDPPPVIYRKKRKEGNAVGNFFRKITGTK